MSEVVVTVRGSFESRHPPELATVYLSVGHEGPDPDAAHRSTAEDTARLVEGITPLFDRDSGPVTRWSNDQIHTWSNRAWNQDGRQLAPVHRADTQLQVTFSDFAELNRWLSTVAVVSGVSVQRIQWMLTDGRRDELTEHARKQAVLDARAKAATYAESLGLAELTPAAIADVGMLGDHASGDGSPAPFRTAMAAFSAAGGPELRLSPEDIELSAAVDVRFVAQ